MCIQLDPYYLWILPLPDSDQKLILYAAATRCLYHKAQGLSGKEGTAKKIFQQGLSRYYGKRMVR
jgi:hypothetical protein